jgi:S1-C subfamily serine protease
MQIETLPPGAAVIETVRLGSRGDLAGLDPGDVIVAVNNRAINGAGSIAQAVQGMHSGDQVPIEVSHGSALKQVNITLATPPFVHP